jgi:hypothetical protein
VNADEHEEIAASVAAGAELGPKYDAAVAEGLVERIGEEIDKRVDARLRNLGLRNLGLGQPGMIQQVPPQPLSPHSGPQQVLPREYGSAGHRGGYSPGLHIVPPGYQGDPRYGGPPAVPAGAVGPAGPGAGAVPPEPPAPRAGAMVAATVLALGSMALGVGATAVVASHAAGSAAQTVMVLLIWGAIAVINIVYARMR